MLKARVIPVLLLKNGRMVKGQQFRDFRDTGDPVSAAKVYNHQDADELVFIDIEASREGLKDRQNLYKVINRVSEECFMPLTIGGGIKNMSDVDKLFKIGADKISINCPLYCEESATWDTTFTETVLLAISQYYNGEGTLEEVLGIISAWETDTTNW